MTTLTLVPPPHKAPPPPCDRKYNSVATIAFTVYHDDPDEVPDAEFLRALLLRIAEVQENNEWQQACGGDFFDTQETSETLT